MATYEYTVYDEPGWIDVKANSMAEAVQRVERQLLRDDAIEEDCPDWKGGDVNATVYELHDDGEIIAEQKVEITVGPGPPLFVVRDAGGEYLSGKYAGEWTPCSDEAREFESLDEARVARDDCGRSTARVLER